MGTPYLYPLYCATCGQRMDPNGDDNLHTDDGESVCSEECMSAGNKDKPLPMVAEVNAMLHNIPTGPKP